MLDEFCRQQNCVLNDWSDGLEGPGGAFRKRRHHPVGGGKKRAIAKKLGESYRPSKTNEFAPQVRNKNLEI